jgi:hypothetical protein
MPQINYYEAEVTIRFAVNGPLSAAGAAKAAEERAAKALAGSGLSAYDDPVESAQIIAITVEDTTARPRSAGGHR